MEKVYARKEAPRRECLEDRCGVEERWWMWGGNRPLVLAFIAHMLFIHLFFSTLTPLYHRLLALSRSNHPPLTLHPFLAHGVFLNPTFYPIITPPGLRGWSSRCLSEPCLSSFDQEDASQDLLLLLLLQVRRNFRQTLTWRQKPVYVQIWKWMKSFIYFPFPSTFRSPHSTSPSLGHNCAQP